MDISIIQRRRDLYTIVVSYKWPMSKSGPTDSTMDWTLSDRGESSIEQGKTVIFKLESKSKIIGKMQF